jgi:pimeloyl-ACP methyl ester carboxylesterase
MPVDATGPRPPGLLALLREMAEVPAVAVARWRRPVDLPKTGHGQPILIYPGFMADDSSTALLRNSLNAAGYRAFTWDLGFNILVSANMVELLRARLDAVRAEAGGQDVILIGWSLGGLFARQVANADPAGIAMVITLGSPFSGDLRANNAWRLIEWTNGHPVDALPMPIGFREKPTVHTIAIWSAQDGIVAPETSQGDPDQSDEQIELNCTHMGFAASEQGVRDVIAILAERLGC